MIAYVVGKVIGNKGSILFCTAESNSRNVVGEIVLKAFTTEQDVDIGVEISVYARKNRDGTYSYFKKKG